MYIREYNMWEVGLFVGAVVTVWFSYWVHKWWNPKCNGVLPPGSMGIPLIGETFELFAPSYSMELPPFINNRLRRYGSIFKTNVAGRCVVVSADPDFNYYLLQQHGKLVDLWALGTFGKVFNQRGSDGFNFHKYVRNLTLNHFGVESLRDKLLPHIEQVVCETLHSWSTQDSVELKSVAAKLSIDFGARQLFNYDPEKVPVQLSVLFNNFVEGLMALPLNIPGTTHHRCMKNHEKVLHLMRDALKVRHVSPGKHPRDVLGHLIEDMKTEKCITDDFIVQLMFSLLFVSSDSVSTTLALAFKLLVEHPLALQELTTEHEAIVKKRVKVDSPMTWEEYKSMTFTRQVINEVLRLANIGPGLFRKALTDIPVNGYTIPKDWMILIATSALHLNSSKFEDPLAFNPWRWKDLEPTVIAKNFMPFGSGMKQCAGSDYTRVFVSTFLHFLVTKYRWAKVNGCNVVRSPIIRFPDGFHFKVSAKND